MAFRAPLPPYVPNLAPRDLPPPNLPPPALDRPRRWPRRLRWALIAAIWSGLAIAVVLLWFLRDLPRPETALEAVRRPSLTLLDRSGRPFAHFGDLVGEVVHLADLPPALANAVVATEDRRFWQHDGLDPIGLGRALLVDLRAGHVVQGGSTITQQVAKTLFLSNARTVRRKLQELLLTLWLERHFTKREILEIWLNRVYFGAGAWGVDAAARIYFNISARHLEVWQAAMLAGLPRAPSRFNPLVSQAAATARTREVLAAMVANGSLPAAEAARAAAAIRPAAAAGGQAGWFADWAGEQARPLLAAGEDAVLRTTLDARLQQAVEARLAAILAGPGASADVGEGAVVVLDAATGAVRAMAGGRQFAPGAFNRATLARRQPGSAFKPFVWLTALEHGAEPDDTVLDAPIRIGDWQPADFEPHYLGPITLEEALAQSANTAAVRLLLRSGGAAAVIATARRLGIVSRLPDEASLALGTGEVGLLELTAAYAPFFNGGLRVVPGGIAAISDGAGQRTVASPPAVRVIPAGEAAMMARMLEAVVARGTGRTAAVAGRVVGGKTGTTQDFRDAWFVGSASGLLVGVWLGNDDGTPMRGVTGGTLPARLFHEIVLAIRPPA